MKSSKNRKHDLVFVTLNNEQIKYAKQVNGIRKKITHALICGPHGQILGTEKLCRKYYSVWVNIFPFLFRKGVETDCYKIKNYKSTFNLVNKLIAIHDSLERANHPLHKKLQITKKKNKKGILARLFGKIS